MDAVRAIIRSRPEVVLLDLNLPRYLADTEDEEGFRVLDFAREVLGPDALVVLMTRDDSGEIRDAARTRGADALLAKPLKIAELERILRARRSSRAWRRCGAEGSAQATGCRPGKDGRRRNHVHENEDE
jgi:DNA-binding response OmpR family regulator